MFENGVLQYINDAAYGDMKDLINDVGINDESIPFCNLAVKTKMQNERQYESDPQYQVLEQAYFPPIDGTNHEECFVGWNEVPDSLPITNLQFLSPLREEEWP